MWQLAIDMLIYSAELQTNTHIVMATEYKITEIFVMADKFCIVFNEMLHRRELQMSEL